MDSSKPLIIAKETAQNKAKKMVFFCSKITVFLQVDSADLTVKFFTRAESARERLLAALSDNAPQHVLNVLNYGKTPVRLMPVWRNETSGRPEDRPPLATFIAP